MLNKKVITSRMIFFIAFYSLILVNVGTAQTIHDIIEERDLG